MLHRDLRPANVLVSEQGVCKVADFGTSRFLEIAAHGTTVIGSPPYMAPEQFHGKAVFASDLYSLGVTMYQMLTGVLPYDTPAPADIDRLLRGELVTPPRLKNAQFPSGSTTSSCRRWRPTSRAATSGPSDLLDDVLELRPQVRRPTPARSRREGPHHAAPPLPPCHDGGPAASTARRRARAAPRRGPRFCWNCRKPLHARSDRCPFCGEVAVNARLTSALACAD